MKITSRDLSFQISRGIAIVMAITKNSKCHEINDTSMSIFEGITDSGKCWFVLFSENIDIGAQKKKKEH